MKLIEHIKQNHDGNVSAFARTQSVRYNQAQRWIDRGCEWHDNNVWCKITKRNGLYTNKQGK